MNGHVITRERQSVYDKRKEIGPIKINSGSNPNFMLNDYVNDTNLKQFTFFIMVHRMLHSIHIHNV